MAPETVAPETIGTFGTKALGYLRQKARFASGLTEVNGPSGHFGGAQTQRLNSLNHPIAYV